MIPAGIGRASSTPAPSTSAPSTPSAPAPSAPSGPTPANITPDRSSVIPGVPHGAKTAAERLGVAKTKPVSVPDKRETPPNHIPEDVDEFEKRAFGEETETVADASDTADTSAQTDTPTETPEDDFSFEFKDGEDTKHTAKPDDETPRTDVSNGARDYSKYDPEVAAVLKKLPNALYAKYADQLQAWKQDANKLKDVQTELAEVRKSKPGFLTDHPQAYRLSEDFVRARQSAMLEKETAAHWQTQLERIEQGLDWEDFRGYDQQGQPIFQTMPAQENGQIDVRARVRAQTEYSTAIMAQRQAEQQAMAIKSSHAETLKATTGEFEANMTKLFKGMAPEKLNGKSADLYKNMVASVPAAWRGHPLTKYLALAGVSVYQNAMAYKNELVKLKGTANTAKPTPANPRNRMQPGQPQASTVFNIEDL